MPADDFLTNVEEAWLVAVSASTILAAYNWERWDSDRQLKQPRARLALSSRTDPEEGPYQRVSHVFTFEGRPKRHKLSVVVNEFKTLLETVNLIDLQGASNNTVQFFGKGENIMEDRRVEGGLRVWTYGFTLYAQSLV